MINIVDFFMQGILPNPDFLSFDPVDDQRLLLPEFLNKLKGCIVEYRQTHQNQDITFTETYRSNTLQEKYFNDGSSKVRKNGMHHYGIAADSIFLIGGKRSYKGDILLLRKIYKSHGLTILGMWDPLHVQLISVSDQPALRKAVSNGIKLLQKDKGIAQTGEDNAATIEEAKRLVGQV